MCKDPGAGKSLFCSQSTKEAGVEAESGEGEGGRRQVTLGQAGQMKALGLSPEHPGDTTPPSPSPVSYRKSVPRIRGILERGCPALNVSARSVALRLLQGQHHFGPFHWAGVQGRKGSGSQTGCLALPLR